MSIRLTEKAANFAIQMMKENNLDDHVIRVTVLRDTGAFALDVVDEISDVDRVDEFFGVKVITDPKSYLYLHSTVVDFSEAQGGFTFDPPTAN